LPRASQLGFEAVGRGLKILTVGGGKSSSGYITFKTKQAAVDAKQVRKSAQRTRRRGG